MRWSNTRLEGVPTCGKSSTRCYPRGSRGGIERGGCGRGGETGGGCGGGGETGRVAKVGGGCGGRCASR